MKYEEIRTYSEYLGRTMACGVYGHAGHIMVAFAPQNGKHSDYADFGMVEVLSPWIDAGKLMIITPDSIDEETWSNFGGDGASRSARHEAWYHYIVDEMVPMIRERTENYRPLITTGCSMGAFHAANFFLRRPDLFDACICQSGFYRSDFFFGNYMDSIVYNNSPVDFLRNMPADHYYIPLYNERQMIFCIGQGAWEWELIPKTRELEAVMKEKGIHAWFDYWGMDVAHDWPWWKKQIVYFMEKVLGPA